MFSSYVFYFASFKTDDLNFNEDEEKKKIGNHLNIELKKHHHGLIMISSLLYLVKEVLFLLLIIFRFYPFLKKFLQLHFQFLKSIQKIHSCH